MSVIQQMSIFENRTRNNVTVNCVWCVCVYVPVCEYACMHVCIHARVCVCALECMHVYVRVLIYPSLTKVVWSNKWIILKYVTDLNSNPNHLSL